MIRRFTVKLVEFEPFHQISRRSSFVHVGSDVQLLFFWWWWSWNRWGYSPWILDIQILLLQKFGEKKPPVCVILFQHRIRCFLKNPVPFFFGMKSRMTGWWQLKYFLEFSPLQIGVSWSNLTKHFFQRGWFNHQLVEYFFPSFHFLVTKCDKCKAAGYIFGWFFAWNLTNRPTKGCLKSSGVERNQLRCVRVGLHCARPGISMDEQVRQNMVIFVEKYPPEK